MAEEAEGVNVVFGANVTDLTEGIQKVTEMIAKLPEAFAKITAVLAGGELFGEAIKSTNEMIDATRRMMSQTGMAADEAQAWSKALEDSDSSADAFTHTLLQMQMRLNNNAAAFAAYGITTKDASGKLLSADMIFRNVIHTLEELKPGADRNSAALNLLGRSAHDVEPFIEAAAVDLNKLKVEQESLGLTITQSTIQMKKDYTTMQGHVEMVFAAMAKVTAEVMEPRLIALGNAFVTLGPQIVDAMRNAMDTFVFASNAITSGAASIINALQKLVDKNKDLATTTGSGGLVKRAFDEFNDTMRETRIEIAWISGAIESLGIRVIAMADSISIAGTGIKEFAKGMLTSFDDMHAAVDKMNAAHEKNAQKMRDDLKKVSDAYVELRDNIRKTAALNDIYGGGKGGTTPAKPEGGTGSAIDLSKQKGADALAKAELALIKATEAAKLALALDASKEELTILEDENKNKTISDQEYFERLRNLRLADNKAKQNDMKDELAQFDKMRAKKPPATEAAGKELDAKRVEMQGKLNLLLQQEDEIKADTTREYLDQNKALQDKLDMQAATDVEAGRNAQIEKERSIATYKVSTGEKTQQELAAMEADWENRRYEAEMSRLQVSRQQLGEYDLAQKAAIDAQMSAADAKHDANELKNAQALATAKNALAKTADDQIKSSFVSVTSSLMQGTMTIQQAFHKLVTDIKAAFANLVAQKFADKLFGASSGFGQALDGLTQAVSNAIDQIVSSWLVGLGLKKAATTATASAETTTMVGTTTAAKAENFTMAASYAAVAGAAALASAAAIPYYGWAIAAEAGEAIYADGMGMAALASAAGGWWQVPQDTLTNIHKDEMVLPAAEAKGLRNIVNNGGSGGSSGAPVHIHGSPNDTIKMKDLPAILTQLGRKHAFV